MSVAKCTFRKRIALWCVPSMVGSYVSENVPVTNEFVKLDLPTARYPKTAILRDTMAGSFMCVSLYRQWGDSWNVPGVTLCLGRCWRSNNSTVHIYRVLLVPFSLSIPDRSCLERMRHAGTLGQMRSENDDEIGEISKYWNALPRSIHPPVLKCIKMKNSTTGCTQLHTPKLHF
jgi:hypothetical protein